MLSNFPLSGKGLWLENALSDFAPLRTFTQQAALTHLIVRVANGAEAVNAPLLEAVSALALPVWGVVRVFSHAPAFKPTASEPYHQREAETAIQLAQALNLAGLVIEAREGFEGPEGERIATEYVNHLRTELPHLPLALSSWSYPPAHPNFPGREFRAACQVDMPFVFSAAQLRATHAAFAKLSPQLSFAPVLPAFASQQFAFTPEEFSNVLTVAEELNVPTLSAWHWHTLSQPAQQPLAEAFTSWRNAPAEIAFAVPEAPPAPRAAPPSWLTQDTETGVVFFSESAGEMAAHPLITHFFKALRTGQLTEALASYAPEFTHINPHHVTRNPADVAQHYAQLFTRYPAATLAVRHIQGSGRLVAVQWAMQAANGTTLTGQDSFHLNRHNQIVYHDSQYQEPLAES